MVLKPRDEFDQSTRIDLWLDGAVAYDPDTDTKLVPSTSTAHTRRKGRRYDIQRGREFLGSVRAFKTATAITLANELLAKMGA